MNATWQNAKPPDTQRLTLFIPSTHTTQLFIRVIPKTPHDKDALQYIEASILGEWKSLYDLSLESFPFYFEPNTETLTLEMKISPNLPQTFQLKETSFSFQISDTAVEPTPLPSPSQATVFNLISPNTSHIPSGSVSSSISNHAPAELQSDQTKFSYFSSNKTQASNFFEKKTENDNFFKEEVPKNQSEIHNNPTNLKKDLLNNAQLYCFLFILTLSLLTYFFSRKKKRLARPPVANP